MSSQKPRKKPSSGKPTSKVDVAIWVAIIGLIGTLLTAGINALVQLSLKSTQTPATQLPTESRTETVAVSTPALFTETVTPFLSTITATPTLTPLFFDDFLNNTTAWNLYEDSIPGYSVNKKIVGGRLTLSLECQQGFDKICEARIKIPIDTRIRDFQMEFDINVTNLSNGEKAQIGARFRFKDEAYYASVLSTDGSYRVFVLDNPNNYEQTLSQGNNSLINKGEVANHVVVTARGTQFMMSINGQEVAAAEDATLTSKGDFYLIVRLPHYGKKVEVEFDNIKIISFD